MILTITLNPSVDVSYTMDELSIGTVNRVGEVSKTAGGKGLNVSRVLKQTDENVMATGFLGGKLGNFIEEQLEGLSIEHSFVQVEGDTRNCIAIIHDGKQTEILEKGPHITDEEASRFIKQLTEIIKDVELITISGSLPSGLKSEFYLSLLEIAATHNTHVLLDTNGETLYELLEAQSYPYLIKPNESEFATLVGKEFSSEKEMLSALQSDRFRSIPWVIVTLGAEGALIKHEKSYYRAHIPKVKTVNPVGSGDSVVAGFAKGISHNMETVDLIKLGLTFGVLNAMEEKTGHIDVNNIDAITNQIIVNEL